MAIIRKLKPEHELPEVSNVQLEKERKRAQHGHDESNWLISYADMMTLLCIFYIMLFSMSKMNVPEFEKAKAQVAKDLGVQYEAPTGGMIAFIKRVLTSAGVDKQATVTSDGLSVAIAFHSTMFFDTLSAELRDEGRVTLDKLVTALNEKQKIENAEYKVVVEGHTDSRPIVGGDFASNWELSSARASRVVRLFTDNGYKGENLLAIGFGETRAIGSPKNADGSWNEEALAKSRRVIIRVLLPGADSIPWQAENPEAGALPSGGGQTAEAVVVPAPVVMPETVIVQPTRDVPTAPVTPPTR